MSRPWVAAPVGFAAFFLLAGSALAAWSGPPAGTPPANNVAAPINVGTTFQDKAGAAWFDGGVGINSGSGFCIGGSCITSWAQASGPWTTSGTSIYYNTGNVGIGIVAPTAKLHVSGSSILNGQLGLYGGTLGNSGIALFGEDSINNQDGNGLLSIVAGGYQPTGGGGYVYANARGASKLLLHDGSMTLSVGGTTGTAGVAIPWTSVGYLDATDVWFSPRGTSADFYITNAGKVGVGLTSPASSLDVGGTGLYVHGNSFGWGIHDYSTSGIYSSTQVAAPSLCFYNNATNATDCRTSWPASGGQWTTSGTNIYNSNTGNVGIGTAAPAYKLDVAGDVIASSWYRVRGNGGLYWETWGSGFYMSDNYWIRGYNANSGLWMNTGNIGTNGGLTVGYGGAGVGAGGAIIAGSVGIGTQSPTQKLDVNGYVRIRSTNGEGGTIALDGNNGTTMFVENLNGVFRLVNSPWTAQLFSVDQSGNVAAAASVTSPQYCIGASCITSWPSTGTNYWTWDGAATLSNNKGSNMNVYSLLSAVNPNAGSGYAQVSSGTTANAGYNAWFRPNGQRLGYLGWDPTNLNLNLENGANFVVTNGNVGIKTASPAAILHVQGDNVTPTFRITDPSGIVRWNLGNTYNLTSRNAANALNVSIAGDGATASYLAAQGGTVGIGTAAPGTKLDVVGSGGTGVDLRVNGRIQTGDGGGAGGVWLNSANTMFVGQSGTNAAIWTAGAGWALNVTQAGNVGIGTASPTNTLDVGGTGLYVHGNNFGWGIHELGGGIYSSANVTAPQVCLNGSGDGTNCITGSDIAALKGLVNRQWYTMYAAIDNPTYRPGTTYTNSNTWPIEESIVVNCAVLINVDGKTFYSGGSTGSGSLLPMTFTVPPGKSFSYSLPSCSNLPQYWNELR